MSTQNNEHNAQVSQQNTTIYDADEYIPHHTNDTKNDTKTEEIIYYKMYDTEDVERIPDYSTSIVIKPNRFDRIVITNKGTIYANGL